MTPLPEKDYTYGEQLLLEAVKSTYGIPTVGLMVAGFTGFKFISGKVDWFVKEVEEVKDEIVEAADDLYQDAIFRAKNVVAGATVPVSTFKSDSLACYESAKVSVPFVGRVWAPFISPNLWTNCMVRKGYAGSALQDFWNKLT